MTQNQVYGFMFLSFILLTFFIFSISKIEKKILEDKVLCIVSCGHFEVAGVTSEAALRKALGEVKVSLFHSVCEKLVGQGLIYMESVSMGQGLQKVNYQITDKGKNYISNQKSKCDNYLNRTRLGEGLGM